MLAETTTEERVTLPTLPVVGMGGLAAHFGAADSLTLAPLMEAIEPDAYQWQCGRTDEGSPWVVVGYLHTAYAVALDDGVWSFEATEGEATRSQEYLTARLLVNDILYHTDNHNLLYS